MDNMPGHEDLEKLRLENLTEEYLEAAVQLFREGGWDEESVWNVRQEMKACLRGDLPGYVRPRFIVARIKEQVVGAAAWAPSCCSFDIYELSWATVAPRWRHRGINERMLRYRLEKARELHGPGVLDVLVCTWVNAMYSRAGFTPLLPPGKSAESQPAERILLRARLTDKSGA